MWGAIGTILSSLFGAIFHELFSFADRPDTVVETPPPVLVTLNPGGVVDDDLVSMYHRRGGVSGGL